MKQGALVCADPAGFAVETAAMVDGLAVQCYSRASPYSVQTVRELLLGFVRARLAIAP
ncbi:hypothetical protein [Subtercola boreus]|uniref:hypothetical protein n=1 Tax=Subtercola boreus TaxID=120213 RepID=UPI001558E8E3|nr:hypothetical protein [Subtercola boreus]